MQVRVGPHSEGVGRGVRVVEGYVVHHHRDSRHRLQCRRKIARAGRLHAEPADQTAHHLEGGRAVVVTVVPVEAGVVVGRELVCIRVALARLHLDKDRVHGRVDVQAVRVQVHRVGRVHRVCRDRSRRVCAETVGEGDSQRRARRCHNRGPRHGARAAVAVAACREGGKVGHRGGAELDGEGDGARAHLLRLRERFGSTKADDVAVEQEAPIGGVAGELRRAGPQQDEHCLLQASSRALLRAVGRADVPAAQRKATE
mmetsp:Transcript_35837/g.107178  ORF Transcript_35837/g.107178 Transcript_35837/m.107178 type:complete len:257 (-) Transcript_35837:36-806(-)